MAKEALGTKFLGCTTSYNKIYHGISYCYKVTDKILTKRSCQRDKPRRPYVTPLCFDV